MGIDLNHPDFNLGLDTTFNCQKLEKEYLQYALGDRATKVDSQTQELASKLHEENVANSKNQKIVGDEFAADRLGTVLDYRVFLQRLNKIIPARYSSFAKNKMLGLQVWAATSHGGEWQFVCGAQPFIVPEFSTMYFNSHNVPTSEKYRGWRTVLLRLILSGFVTEDQVIKEFGQASGRDSGPYRQTLHAYRNR